MKHQARIRSIKQRVARLTPGDNEGCPAVDRFLEQYASDDDLTESENELIQNLIERECMA